MNFLERLQYITRSSLVRWGWIRAAPPQNQKENPEIAFQALEPVSLQESQESTAPTNCFCPVTRQQLKWGTKIYQCRACKMSYSVEGWEFLQQVDGGRCCGCRSKKTVFPLR
jgi:hypothetical protein